MLIKFLPRESALVAAMNDGEPVWGYTEHLLADLWALLVKVNSDPKKTRENIDHPAREAITAKVRARSKRSLKDYFLARKRAYMKSDEEVI